MARCLRWFDNDGGVVVQAHDVVSLRFRRIVAINDLTFRDCVLYTVAYLMNLSDAMKPLFLTLIIVSGLTLGACGQKGPLTLPEPGQTAEQK